MSEELELSGSNDVTESAESSPVAEKVSSEQTSERHESQAQVTESKPEPKEAPFHEHPRFKELISQRNELTTQYQQSQKAIQDLTARLEEMSRPKSADPTDELKARLKNVDPVFAEQFSRLLDASKELEGLKNWKSQFERQTYHDQAMRAVDALRSELKVDPVLHDTYLHKIPAGVPLDKIQEIYRAEHDKFTKFISDRERSALSKYTSEKKSDASIPTPSKGNQAKMAPNVSNKMKLSKDPQEARAQLVKAVRDQIRAGNE